MFRGLFTFGGIGSCWKLLWGGCRLVVKWKNAVNQVVIINCIWWWMWLSLCYQVWYLLIVKWHCSYSRGCKFFWRQEIYSGGVLLFQRQGVCVRGCLLVERQSSYSAGFVCLVPFAKKLLWMCSVMPEAKKLLQISLVAEIKCPECSSQCHPIHQGPADHQWC